MKRMRRVACLYLIVLGSLISCSSAPQKIVDHIRFGCAQEPLSLLVMIARQQGFFEDAGLRVEFTDYASGKLAFSGLLKNEVACAVTSEVPIVFQSFKRSDFRMVAVIGRAGNEPRIVGRTDRGILKPKDLRGKRIGTQRASAVHFFLSLFLMENGISEDDVSIVFMAGKDLPTALERGEIDAFSMREPFVTQAKQALPNQVRVFDSPSLYQKTFTLVLSTQRDEIQPRVVEKLLTALVEAERFFKTHPEQANAIGAEFLGIRIEDLASITSGLDLRVLIDQALILSLEDEARWAVQGGLVEGKDMPNYLGLIDQSGLKAIRPRMATVIH